MASSVSDALENLCMLLLVFLVNAVRTGKKTLYRIRNVHEYAVKNTDVIQLSKGEN